MLTLWRLCRNKQFHWCNRFCGDLGSESRVPPFCRRKGWNRTFLTIWIHTEDNLIALQNPHQFLFLHDQMNFLNFENGISTNIGEWLNYYLAHNLLPIIFIQYNRYLSNSINTSLTIFRLFPSVCWLKWSCILLLPLLRRYLRHSFIVKVMLIRYCPSLKMIWSLMRTWTVKMAELFLSLKIWASGAS